MKITLKSHLKTFAHILGAAALVAGCASTGTTYKYKYQGMNLLGNNVVVYIDIYDSGDDTYVEQITPTRMELCSKGKIKATKTLEEGKKIFTLTPKDFNCPNIRYVIDADGSLSVMRLGKNGWAVNGSKIKLYVR